jgi:hypothetical protein
MERGYSTADGFYVGDKVTLTSLGHKWTGHVREVKGHNSHACAVKLDQSDAIIWTEDYKLTRIEE